MRCSFLPDSEPVEHKLKQYVIDELDLRDDGAVLETNRPYLIPLIEEVALPPEVRGRANPKSSTGRLDVFTRVITDRSYRFDEISAGYHGRLWLEVVPLSFTVRVRERLALNQLRLAIGDASLDDDDLRATHAETPLLYRDGGPVPADELATANGLFLGLDLDGGLRTPRRLVRPALRAAGRPARGRPVRTRPLLGAGHRRGRRPHRAQPRSASTCCCPTSRSSCRPTSRPR